MVEVEARSRLLFLTLPNVSGGGVGFSDYNTTPGCYTVSVDVDGLW